MKKSIKRIMSMFMTFLILISMFQTVVLATTPGGKPVNANAEGVDTAAEQELGHKIKIILRAFAYFGYAITLGMFMYIGAKYALSAASDRAQVKQGLINYFIGAIVIASASVIANIVSSVATGGTTGLTGIANDIISTATSVAGTK